MINLPIVEKPVPRPRSGRRPERLARTRASSGTNRQLCAEADVAKFKAIVVEKADKGQTVSLTEFDEANLMDGDVTVRVDWSTINYKDGLAITGKAPVVRRFPMIPGIDFAGTVEASSHPDWKPGDKVILNGWGAGRNPSRRLCREGARQRPMAGAAAGRHERARGDGDRHRGLHRDAGGDGAGAARPQARPRARWWSPARPAASARSRSRCLPSSASRSSPRPAGREEADYLKGLGASRDHRPQRAVGAGRSRSPRSAGPAASTRSAPPRSPTCCR